MLDKIANQKLFFISLIGIVVTSMILTTTFAYQSIRVNYSEGADSEVSVNAGTLDVKYCRNDECVDPTESESNYNKISVDNLSFLPNYKTASYVEFVVDNRSSSDDVAYMITLSDLTYNKMFVSEAFKYTVVVVNEDGTLTEIITDNFSTLTGDSFDLNLEDRIYKYIEKGKIEKVRIYLWLDENVDVQLDLTDTSDRQFMGYVNVSSIFDGEVPPGLLSNLIIKNAKKNIDGRTQYSEVPLTIPAAVASGENEMTLSSTQDDYGTSYYFRGNVIDNYINFNNMCWRIVRIQGDGSIKLILADSMNLCNSEAYSVDNSSSAFVGNGGTGSNGGSSWYSLEDNVGMRTKLNEWYSNNFASLNDYIKTEKWCVTNTYLYSVAIYGAFDEGISSPDSGFTDSYKRFTVDNTASLICDVTSNVEENIGILYVDELMFAGGLYDENDVNILNNYLKVNSNAYTWRLFGIIYFNGDNIIDSKTYSVSSKGNVLSDTFDSDSYYRPSIVLKDTVIGTGEGTIEEPYEVVSVS